MEEQVAGQLLKPQFLCPRGDQYVVAQLQGGVVEPCVDRVHPLHQPSGHRRRGFERRMRHHVRHARILVMADTRQHRQRELRHVGAEPVGIEAVEVAGRTAAADDDHGVELLHAVGHGAQRRNDRLLGRRTLHERIEEREAEPVGAFADLLAEILVAGGIGARNDGYALYDGGHPDLAVHVPHALLVQTVDGLLPLPLHVAQRVGRVDVGDLERESVEFVVVDGDFCQDLDPCGEPLPGFCFEITRNAGIGRAPDHGARLCQRHAVIAPFLDEFQVAVSRIVDFDLGDLGAHPDGQGKTLVEGLLHEPL